MLTLFSQAFVTRGWGYDLLSAWHRNSGFFARGSHARGNDTAGAGKSSTQNVPLPNASQRLRLSREAVHVADFFAAIEAGLNLAHRRDRFRSRRDRLEQALLVG